MAQSSTILRAIICEIAAINFNGVAVSKKVADSPIDRILKRIFVLDLPGREHFENYMRYKWRMNHKPSTLNGSFVAVSSFLLFYAVLGKNQLQEIGGGDAAVILRHL